MKAIPATYLVTVSGQTFLKVFRMVRVPRMGELVVIAGFHFRIKDVGQDLDSHTDGFYSDYGCDLVYLEIESGQEEAKAVEFLSRNWQVSRK